MSKPGADITLWCARCGHAEIFTAAEIDEVTHGSDGWLFDALGRFVIALIRFFAWLSRYHLYLCPDCREA